MAGRTTQVALTLPESPRPRGKRKGRSKAPPATFPADPARIEALREWRRREAARRSVPAYVVLHDRTLEALVAARPATLGALSEVPGIGPAKLEAYGEDLLALFGAGNE
jgi:superfamily II DNA helicase RecQ